MGYLWRGKILYTLLFVLLALVFGMLGYAFYQGYLINQYIETNVYNYGVFVDGTHLGGMTRYEAEEAVLKKCNLVLGRIEVALKFENKFITLTSEDFGARACVGEALDTAYAIGREGTPTRRLKCIQELPSSPVYFESEATLDYTKLKQRVKDLLEEEDQPARDAYIMGFDPYASDEVNRFTYQYEKKGRKANFEKVWERIKEEIDNRTYGVVMVEYEDVLPIVTVKDLKSYNTKIASMTTNLNGDNDRFHNIMLGCEAVSGYTLGPGDVFDFNEVVGERTADRGYQETEESASGEMLDNGMGGGICQVSGTLYNAAVLADMEIIERNAHAFELSYLSWGRDAKVDNEQKNLSFANPYDTPVYIIMWVDGAKNEVTAEIYGALRQDGVSIDLVVEAQPRDKGEHDRSCDSYRVYYNANGDEIRREHLFEDNYMYTLGEHSNAADDTSSAAKTMPDSSLEPPTT